MGNDCYEIEQLKQRAVEITKLITPQYPLGYTEVYMITFNYIKECKKANALIDIEVLRDRISWYVVRGKM